MKMQIIYELSGKSALDFSARIGYNDTAPIWTGIEVVITALTRNQVVSQEARGFESHPVRQYSMVILIELPCYSFMPKMYQKWRFYSSCGTFLDRIENPAAKESESLAAGYVLLALFSLFRTE